MLVDDHAGEKSQPGAHLGHPLLRRGAAGAEGDHVTGDGRCAGARAGHHGAVPVPLGERPHARRVTLKSSQVGTVASSQRARWDARRRMQLALTMLTDSALDVLITGESAFDVLPEQMARIASEPGDTLCHRIKYG